MHRSQIWSKFVTAALLVALPVLGLPVSAGVDDTGLLAGVVISSADRTPLAGARVHVSDAGSGSLFSSAATDGEGRFSLDSLPSSSYEVAVEVDGGLYLVGSRVALAPGQVRDIDVAIDDRQPGAKINAKAGSAAKGVSAWNNPATAALIVLGSAFVVGAIVENVIDDDDEGATVIPASKFQPF